MLRFCADEHVAYAVVHALRARGVDVVTVQELGQGGMDDEVVLAKALNDSRALLTNDTDFLILAAEHQDQGQPFAPVFFWPQQQRSVGDLVRRIVREASLDDYTAASSRVYYL